MSEKRQKRSVGTVKSRDPISVQKFLEELSWVLSTHSNLDFRAIANAGLRSPDKTQNLDRHVSKNPNIHFLIGALPIMFSDEKIFPSNEDLAGFASEALQLPISRWEKRSRYELIGFIVCETAKLDDFRLEFLVNALAKITSDDSNVKAIIMDKKIQNLSWNEVIQRLTGSAE